MDVSSKNDGDEQRERRKRLSAECAARLTAAREALGLRKAEAAARLGVPRSTWQDFELGALPDAVRGGEIEDMLGVPRGSIYRRSTDEQPDSPVVDRSADFDQTEEG